MEVCGLPDGGAHFLMFYSLIESERCTGPRHLLTRVHRRSLSRYTPYSWMLHLQLQFLGSHVRAMHDDTESLILHPSGTATGLWNRGVSDQRALPKAMNL